MTMPARAAHDAALSRRLSELPPGPEKAEAFCRFMANLAEQVAEVAFLAIPRDPTAEGVAQHIGQKGMSLLNRAYALRGKLGLSDSAYDGQIDRAIVESYLLRLEQLMGPGAPEWLGQKWREAFIAEPAAGNA